MKLNKSTKPESERFSLSRRLVHPALHSIWDKSRYVEKRIFNATIKSMITELALR